MLQKKEEIFFSVTFPSIKRGEFSQTLGFGAFPRILWKINCNPVFLVMKRKKIACI
jgi:hypothetical protein